MTIYTLRTTSGREDIVADMMLSKIRAEKLGVRAIAHPAELKGYIFIEGRLGDIHKAIHGMLHIRGLIEKPVNMGEIEHFFDTKKARIAVGEEDVVEIIGGPFKGERGKIQRIDKAKDEVTVELLEASVPIPVTIATEFVKLIKKSKAVRETEALKEEEREEVGLPSAEEIRERIAEKPPEPAEKPAEEEEPEKREAPKKEEFKAPETPEEEEMLTAPVVPREGPKEKKPAEEKKPEEPVVMESEEELVEKPVIPLEAKDEKPEESPLIAELEKEKKKKKPLEDLEEGE